MGCDGSWEDRKTRVGGVSIARLADNNDWIRGTKSKPSKVINCVSNNRKGVKIQLEKKKLIPSTNTSVSKVNILKYFQQYWTQVITKGAFLMEISIAK